MRMATVENPPPPDNDGTTALAAPVAEGLLCGAMMLANDIIDPVADLLGERDFSDPFFGHLFGVIVREHSLGKPATPATLQPFFDAQSFAAIASLTGADGAWSTIGAARDFARHIADLAKRRRLIAGLEQVIEKARVSEEKVEALVETADTAMTEALQRSSAVRTVTLAQSFDETLKAIEDEAAGLGPQGIRIVGLDDFNELTGDLRRGELMYLGGRPSMGKTALAVEIGLGAARGGNGVSIISLEMRSAELTTRAMTTLVFDHGGSCPTFEQVRRGKLTDRDRELLKLARKQIDQWPLLITDPPSLKIGRLAMEIRRQRRRMVASGQKLDLVVIDYLGLIKGSDQRAKRYEEVGEISRALKSVAKECDVAIVCLAQLNRECEKRDDKRPMLSDLRDAGDIEQDADHVMFVYRDEYYLERSEPDSHDKKRPEWETAMGFARDKIELIAAKVRNGRVGKRTCHFFGRHQAVRASDFLMTS